MSSTDAARLTVGRGSPTLEIEVLDSNFEPVARGVCGLEATLAPGLYEIRFRDGTAHASELRKIEPGENSVPPPEFEAVSPAPVDQTRTSHEYHQKPVLAANETIARDCASPGPETGGVVVMVRNVAGQEALRFPDDIGDRFAVVDAAEEALDAEGEHWTTDAAPAGRNPDWALWSRAVTPGGHALRIQDPESSEVVYQSIWVDEGWQTLVFIPNTPDGPVPELASVHVVRVGEWTPYNEGSTAAVALESVLAALRAGRSVVPADLNRLFDGKAANPFLGIAAAHALLLEPEPSLQLLETVVGHLERQLPRSPDVVALGHRAKRAGAKVVPRDGAVWPPMMYIGYRALLRADADNPGVISDGSPAEDIAARVRVAGLWTTWAAKRPGTGAVARLKAFVDDAAAIRGQTRSDVLDGTSVKQLAHATGLPSAAVVDAIGKLRAGA